MAQADTKRKHLKADTKRKHLKAHAKPVPKPKPLPMVRPSDDGMDSYMNIYGIQGDQPSYLLCTVRRAGTFQELKDLANKVALAINMHDDLAAFLQTALNAGLCTKGQPLGAAYQKAAHTLDLVKGWKV